MFIHYRDWLEKHHPDSQNLSQVRNYLDAHSGTQDQGASEGQIETQRSPKLKAAQHDQHPANMLLSDRGAALLCSHCGNITFKKLLYHHQEYALYECEICRGIILCKSLSRLPAILLSPSLPDNHHQITGQDAEQLWPPAFVLTSEVPERIRTLYKEARDIKSKSPSSFVVLIRRALEALAKDRKAKGKDLYNQIEELIQKEQLPQIFGEMTHISRLIAIQQHTMMKKEMCKQVTRRWWMNFSELLSSMFILLRQKLPESEI